MANKVILKNRKNISIAATASFFRRVQFNDWFSKADVSWYLQKALYVASAWEGRKCIGIAVLTGDGRIDVSLNLLAVDPSWQGRGIGSRLMERVIARVERLKPYHFSVEVCERHTERYYRRFDFQRNKGTWLLEYAPTANRLRRIARAARAAPSV